MKTGSILRIVLGAAVTPVPVTFNFAGSVRALVIATLLVCSAIPARAELQLTRVFSNPNPPSGSEALSLPQFGFSVAWLGNRPLIGAPGLDRFLPNGTLFADAGAAYLFDADTASLLATFLPPISISEGGHAVAAVAGRALVGNPNVEFNGVGRAFLFDDSGTVLTEFLPIRIPGVSLPPNPVNARVGFAVGGTCETAVIGAPGANQVVGSSELFGAGAAILYALDEREPVGALRPPAPEQVARFGSAIATLGNLVLVGAPGAQAGRGAALLFDGATGVALRSVTSFRGGANQEFGAAVALTADVMIVGVPGSNAGRGGVQVFGPDGAFNLPHFGELTPAGAGFGSAVAGLGRTVVAGAPGASEAWAFDPQQRLVPLFSHLPEAGAVYVHDLEGGLLQTLVSPVPTPGERFGASIAVSGRRVLVGAPGADGGRGVVYLFEQPIAQAPIVSDQTVTTLEDIPASISLQGSDPSGTGLTHAILCPPNHGVLSGTPPLLTYTPAPGYAGPDAFTYRVANTLADSVVATVSITVTAVNDAPVVQNQKITTAAGVVAGVTLTGSDPEGAPLSFRILAPPAHGRLSGTPPSVVYTPDPGFTGLDQFTFVGSDGALTSAPGTVTISVMPVLAIADTSVVEPDTGAVGAVFTVSLSPASAGTVTVPFKTADGSALAGLDYQASGGTLTFRPGTTTQRVLVSVIGDRRLEPTKTFRVELGVPTGALVTRGQAIGIIFDNDPPIGTSSLEPTEAVAAPGEPVTLTLTWTHPTRWRELRTLDLRISDERDVVLWVRLHEAERTLSLVKAAGDTAGHPVPFGSPRRLETPMAAVHLRESRAFDDGPGGQTLGLALRVTFKPRAAGRTYQVDAFASDDAGNEQGFDRVGSVTVLGKAHPPALSKRRR